MAAPKNPPLHIANFKTTTCTIRQPQRIPHYTLPILRPRHVPDGSPKESPSTHCQFQDHDMYQMAAQRNRPLHIANLKTTICTRWQTQGIPHYTLPILRPRHVPDGSPKESPTTHCQFKDHHMHQMAAPRNPPLHIANFKTTTCTRWQTQGIPLYTLPILRPQHIPDGSPKESPSTYCQF